MECVKLFYKDELVGILTYNAPNYCFSKNEEFSKKSILYHMGLNEKCEYYSTKLFHFFYKFIPEKERIDIIEKANINLEVDSEYEILKKVARLYLNKSQFWIGLWLLKKTRLKDTD